MHKKISKRTRLPYSAGAMYRLVADIEHYPDFLPWCDSVTIHNRNINQVDASLQIVKGPFRKRVRTLNTMSVDESITIELIEGPFKHLQGLWFFKPLEKGCEVEFDIEFEMEGALFAKVLGPIFEEIASKMVEVFSARARQRIDSYHTNGLSRIG